MGRVTGMLLPLIILIAIMYFMLIRPQKKREREVNAMRSNLHVGDEIITIGGICGKIVKTKEETIVIQVGADKLKFEMMRWSVSKVIDSVEKKDIRRREEAAEAEEYEEAEETKARPKRLEKAAPAAEEVEETVAEEAPAEAEEVAEEAEAEVSEAAEEAPVEEAEAAAEEAKEE